MHIRSATVDFDPILTSTGPEKEQHRTRKRVVINTTNFAVKLEEVVHLRVREFDERGAAAAAICSVGEGDKDHFNEKSVAVSENFKSGYGNL